MPHLQLALGGLQRGLGLVIRLLRPRLPALRLRQRGLRGWGGGGARPAAGTALIGGQSTTRSTQRRPGLSSPSRANGGKAPAGPCSYRARGWQRREERKDREGTEDTRYLQLLDAALERAALVLRRRPRRLLRLRQQRAALGAQLAQPQACSPLRAICRRMRPVPSTAGAHHARRTFHPQPTPSARQVPNDSPPHQPAQISKHEHAPNARAPAGGP